MILEKLCPLQLEAPKQENPPLKFAFTGNYTFNFYRRTAFWGWREEHIGNPAL